MSSRRQTGHQGEDAAAAHLVAHGYQILARNWRTRFGELDVVARQGRTIVFVEVRTRGSTSLGTAEESVGPDKQRRLVRMAEQYLQQHAPNASARIDVIAVRLTLGAPPDVHHVVGAVTA